MDRISSGASRSGERHIHSHDEHAQEPDGTPATNGASILKTPPPRASHFHSLSNGSASPDQSVLTPGSAKRAHSQQFFKIQADAAQKRRSYEVNNLPTDTLKALESYVDVVGAMLDAIDNKDSPFAKCPEELSVLIRNHKNLLALLDRDMKHYRTSGSTPMWNLAAGAMAFALCFGPGTLASGALARPWLALVISPFFWTLTERLIPMMRATSWANRHADALYPLLMRLHERIARDWIRQCGSLPGKKYAGKTTHDPAMSASEYRNTISMLDAWKGKVATDDVPYFFYSFYYALRSTLLTVLATTAYLRTVPGMALSLTTLFIAGCCAGASTSATFQAARRRAYQSENPASRKAGETLVKSREIWAAEALFVGSQLTLLDKYKEDMPAGKAKASLEMCRQLLEADLRKAQMKSGWMTSIGFELRCLFQEKRMPGASDAGEVAGRLVETVSGYLGKATCLVPAVVFNQAVAIPFTSEEYSLIVRIVVVVASCVLLIIGFGFRKEAEMLWRMAVGIILGLDDLIARRLLGRPDKYSDAHNTSLEKIAVQEDLEGQRTRTSPHNSDQSSSDVGLQNKAGLRRSVDNTTFTVDGQNFVDTSYKAARNGKHDPVSHTSLRQPQFSEASAEKSSTVSDQDSETS